MMVNVIIVFVVAVLFICAFSGSFKYFSGEKSCCDEEEKIEVKEKKLENPVIGKKQMEIEGMHCQNCEAKVTNKLNEIDGVLAIANYEKGEAIVFFDRRITNNNLRKAVEDIGYSVKSIKDSE